jgi:hypothetical protein
MEPEINAAFDAATDPVTRRFLPGNNANPAGRASTKIRIRAEAERLVHEFAALYGRVPNHAESVQIGTCAMLIIKMATGRSRRGVAVTAEDAVKLSNSLARALRRVGLGSMPTRTIAPRPSALAVLNGGGSK